MWSSEHASVDCPHGLLDTECAYCKSKVHSTNDCPHDLLSTKCGLCGDKEHGTDNCPHGFFESKCGYCSSTAHGTNDCPHDIFENQCGYCKSTSHATNDCPQQFTPPKQSPKPEAKNTSIGVSTLGGGSLMSAGMAATGPGSGCVIVLAKMVLAVGSAYLFDYGRELESTFGYLLMALSIPGLIFGLIFLVVAIIIYGIFSLVWYFSFDSQEVGEWPSRGKGILVLEANKPSELYVSATQVGIGQPSCFVWHAPGGVNSVSFESQTQKWSSSKPERIVTRKVGNFSECLVYGESLRYRLIATSNIDQEIIVGTAYFYRNNDIRPGFNDYETVRKHLRLERTKLRVTPAH